MIIFPICWWKITMEDVFRQRRTQSILLYDPIDSALSLLNLHVLQASITWKQCADLPTGLSAGKTTVISGNVYCGGAAATGDECHMVHCYNPPQDMWTTLPPLPVRYFGLGQLNGKLVAVGGAEKGYGNATNKVYNYHERSKKWKQTIPPMPTARNHTSVVSLQSALVVVGGEDSDRHHTHAVELFKADISQWYRTDPLPTACRNISLTIIGTTCYALGGYDGSNLNQALYASVDDLLRNAVPANQTTHSGRRDTQSAWKNLAVTPTCLPASAVLAGSLLAIGGSETSQGGTTKKEVYRYSLSTNSWIHITDLPVQRYATAAAVLSSTELLVIGGAISQNRVNNVYKGILSFI